GLVSRLKPGVFVIVPPELGSTVEYAADPYLTATRLAGGTPCFISHASAMELHRMVTQPQLAVFVSSAKRPRSRTVHDTEFRCVFIKPEHYFGTMKYWVTKQEASASRNIAPESPRSPRACGCVIRICSRQSLWIMRCVLEPERSCAASVICWSSTRSHHKATWHGCGMHSARPMFQSIPCSPRRGRTCAAGG